MRFEDHFSRQAALYARYRPGYPPQLFTYLASISPRHELAWDCGTGNGQAAVELAEHFARVIATDASPEQIANARPHGSITYRVEPAEAVTLPSGSVDLVTVAIAVHWFDLDRFYPEVRRVLKSAGILAVWTYHLPTIEPAIDQVLASYYGEVLAGYWPERFQYVHERYRTLPFPFAELQPPTFKIETSWDLGQLLGFLDSWSATRRYEKAAGRHPVLAIWPDLAGAWGDPERRRVLSWPLHLRVGQVE